MGLVGTRGLFERGGGGLINSPKWSTSLSDFSKNQKMVSILHKELRHKVEMLKHVMLEVLQPKIKTNSNSQHMQNIG